MTKKRRIEFATLSAMTGTCKLASNLEYDDHTYPSKHAHHGIHAALQVNARSTAVKVPNGENYDRKIFEVAKHAFMGKKRHGLIQNIFRNNHPKDYDDCSRSLNPSRLRQKHNPRARRSKKTSYLVFHQLREPLLSLAPPAPAGGNEPPKLPWCCARVLMFFAITAASSSDNLRIVVITGRSLACSDGSEVLRAPTTQFLRYSRLIAAFRPEGTANEVNCDLSRPLH